VLEIIIEYDSNSLSPRLAPWIKGNSKTFKEHLSKILKSRDGPMGD